MCCRVFVPLNQSNHVALNVHLKLQLKNINMF